MARGLITFGQALVIFVVAYSLFFFLFAAADTLFFSPSYSPDGFLGGSLSLDSMAVMFLISIIAIFVVAAVFYYIIVSI
jgi:hypothetical protein